MPSAISRYIEALRTRPLMFRPLDQPALAGATLHRYLLQSQVWPCGEASRAWQHQIDIVRPCNHRPGPVLVLANNRSPYPHPECADPRAAEVDFDAPSISALARDDGCTVISVAQIPNQPLWLPGASQPLSEDDLVAASWQTFMQAPGHDPRLPLQVPMTAAVIRAIDLWRQLQPEVTAGIVVAGMSKRAGAAWLTAMHDPRVVALASLGLDIHFQAVLAHIRQVFAGEWPTALAPYVQAGITEVFQTPAFSQLMRIIDPWAQRHTPEGARLQLPKLIVNASGDDFFPPDSPGLYIRDLPTNPGLLTLPNCDHAGIRRHVVDSLLPFVRRIRHGRPLPATDVDAAPLVASTETPLQRIRWQACNPRARDFRFSQGVRYHGSLLDPARPAGPEPVAASGWHAEYETFHYADGLQLSTPVQVRHRP
ncbi:PhoPQ-activated pathogenicity-related family protein [Frateuria aurantia]|uniref:PhoPQ-activated pathogenicity-related protein n=1 Tax=Frateuria aurantia (strain ATCC 33424 / DSM 6220 / KCTC 2777 / LMG 1558 / NBRC 3245 / NCIMB 13370) TaxID=767434 RepID=H8L1H3_FRAAD|nr:PhoPQ-activated pathogenicity-related protein [Frateuria aurantia]AFC84701.1 PhoPQ-activated pathogenicity-related protein [Frateuria aurantia DSM 6220]